MTREQQCDEGGAASALPETSLCGRVLHDTFTLTQHLPAPPPDVFRAFSDPGLRRRWFRLPGGRATYTHDFRTGGGESAHSTFPLLDGRPQQLAYGLRYLDITPDRRILYVHDAHVDGVLRWTSLVTVEIQAASEGTMLSWTEQVAFVAPTGDGNDDLRHLRGGTRLRLNGLVAALGPADARNAATNHDRPDEQSA